LAKEERQEPLNTKATGSTILVGGQGGRKREGSKEELGEGINQPGRGWKNGQTRTGGKKALPQGSVEKAAPDRKKRKNKKVRL